MRSISIYTLVLGAFLSLVVFASSTEQSEESNSQRIASTTDKELPQRIHSVDLNKSFNYAGEELPMENFDVRERLDRELLRNAYWHSSTVLNIKKAGRFFPIIEPILAEQGIPDDFKFLAVAESDLSNAVSPAGAKGFWQIMKGTARDYGLEINADVDERYHLEKATKVACRYLKKSKEKFNSWTLAAAAYNMGRAGLQRDINSQRANSFYDLNLNKETSKYIFRLVALKEILSNPNDFGFDIPASELYPSYGEFYTIEVNGAVANWGDFAAKYGTTYRMLKVYNPWLISSKLTNKSKKTYKIRVPKKQ